MIRLTVCDTPVYVDPAKIDAIWLFDPYVPSNGSCVAVNGVVVRADEHAEAIHTARADALSAAQGERA